MSNKSRGGMGMKILRRIFRGIVRTIAIVLVFCICCVAIAGCTTAALIAVDALRERGGSMYAELKGKIESAGKILRKNINAGDLDTSEQQIAFIRSQLTEMRDSQAQVDEMLLAELNSGAYALEVPLVVLNPYGIAPLSAVALFTTEQPARISVDIAGDTPQAGVSFDFSEYETDHAIPIYGLYANRANEVTLTARYRDGKSERAEILVQTDVMPAALAGQTVQARTIDAEAYQPGFTFTFMSNNQAFKTAIDINGDFRWYLDTANRGSLLSYTGYCADYNDGNSIFISCGNLRHSGPVALLELNYLGKLLNAWYAPYGAHHDIVPVDGSLLVTGSKIDGPVEDFIYRIDMNTGEITGTFDYADVLQVYRNQSRWDENAEYDFYSLNDWAHINTVVDIDGDLLISSRHQSTVMRNDWDGNIKWILSDPTDYYEYYRQYILTPVGDNFEYCYTQHAPEVLPDQDGDPDTLDILLFDNGDYHKELEDRVSRMVQYRINEREMTVEQIWSWGEERPMLYSYRHGDADLLPNGNRLGSFEPNDLASGTRNAYGVEVMEDGRAVWEIWRMNDDGTNDYSEYRLDRLEIYADSANDLHLGEQAQLFLPEDKPQNG